MLNLIALSIMVFFSTYSAYAVSTHAAYAANDQDRLIRPSYRPGQIKTLCIQAGQRALAASEKILEVPADKRTIQNTLIPFERWLEHYLDEVLPLTSMATVTTQRHEKEESFYCQEQMSKLFLEIYSRKEFFELFSHLERENLTDLSAEDSRLLSQTIRDLEASQTASGEDRLKIEALNAELQALESQFKANLHSDDSNLTLSQSDLAGLSESFFEDLKKGTAEKTYVVTSKSYDEVLEYARSAETRQRVLNAQENRVADKNLKILNDMIEHRQKIASLMGYKTWVDFHNRPRMAKDGKTIQKFLEDLGNRLRKKTQTEIAELLKFKQHFEPLATELNAWDIQYYTNLMKKTKYGVTYEMVQPYFPLDTVLPKLFGVFGKSLGIEFVRIKNYQVWAKEVELYEIRNKSDHKRLAFFYLDLYRRPLKMEPAVAPLRVGRIEDGKLYYPVTVLIENFDLPKHGQPTLLTHGQIKGLVHLIDYVLHQSLITTSYAMLSGFNLDWNFVAASSQMFENWADSPEILTHLSGHYQDPNHKIPAELVQKLLASQELNRGISTMTEMALAMTDFDYHTQTPPLDLVKIYKMNQREWLGVEAIETTQFPASWSMMASVYNAGYYSFLWSRVYGQDLLSRFLNEGLLNPKVGTDFRRKIYEKGSQAEPLDLIRDFLGREPSSDAFYKDLKI